MSHMPQSFTKDLKRALVFMWNSALRQKFNFSFSRAFASINKIFILAGGQDTKFRRFPDIC